MSPLEERSPAAVISAMEANLIVLWRSYGRLPGADVYDQPDLFWVATDTPFPPFIPNPAKVLDKGFLGGTCRPSKPPSFFPAINRIWYHS